MSRCNNTFKDKTNENKKKTCCVAPPSEVKASSNVKTSCCPLKENKQHDWLMLICGSVVIVGYFAYLFFVSGSHVFTDDLLPNWLHTFFHTIYEMVNSMWWGVISAAIFVGLLERIPRELIVSLLGKAGSKRGVFRATLAGLLLDLCNHGILMVGMKLYERGASIGQVMAFLIASPWNSLTLTLILVGLIGLPLTLLFILCSLVIAWISGWVFDSLVKRALLPENPNQVEFKSVPFLSGLKKAWKQEDWSSKAVFNMGWQGFKESKSVLRWVFFGIILIALIRSFVPEDSFGIWFGASASGLFLTLLAATIIEVCSEGSSPIAADLVNRAGAPGNAFTFLMAGAATDYTEIMAVQNTTKSWKIAIALPLITIPQVLFIGWLMNTMGYTLHT